jgi:tryptophan-rich sensory protein
MTITIIVAAALAIVLAGAGGVLTEIGPWYGNLRKPSWQPPDWAFGPAWTIILSLTAAAGVLSWRGAHTPWEHTQVAIYFGVNWILHLLWSPLFFKLRRPDWALVENIALWCSVLALVIGLRQFSHTASWFEVPYLLWVSFALFLNWTIVRLNAPFTTHRFAAATPGRA